MASSVEPSFLRGHTVSVRELASRSGRSATVAAGRVAGRSAAAEVAALLLGVHDREDGRSQRDRG
jgi:hypothetical protein